jgi:VWFA-related protein
VFVDGNYRGCASRACFVSAALACAALAGLSAQQRPPTFTSGVEVVLIDVSVVDKTGRPVDDLAAGDFTVTVDGKPRTVASAQFLRYESRTAIVAAARPAEAPVPAAARPSPPPPRLVIVAIDEDSLETGEGLVVKQAAEKFLDQLAPNDRVGVVTIPRLRSEVTLSTRRSDVKKILDAVITGVNRDLYEFNIGLAEAFDVERGYSDVLQRVVARECARNSSHDCSEQVRMQIRQMQLAARNRAQRSFDALAGLADGLAGVQGPKTVLLISGGMPTPDQNSAQAFDRVEAAFSAAQATLYTLFLERTSYGQVRDRPSPTAFEDANLEREGIENVTSATGGTLMLAIGTLDQYFDRVVTELSGSYLLGIEVAAADRDGRTHQVDLKVTRRDVEVRTRRRYVIEEPRATRGSAAVSRDAGRKGMTAEPAPVTVEAMTPEEEAVVARAGAYATAYEAELSGLVAEERYVQRTFKNQKLTVTSVRPSGGGRSSSTIQEETEWVPEEVRQLKSDFLLVKAPGGNRWLPFRDVVEVDGRKVREREERLQQLFVSAPATAAGRAAEITAESARYNIGFVERNVNLPTLALRFLDPAFRSRLMFRRQGQATVSGARTVEFAFSEHGSPTVVRDGDKDMPATGSFWIDPADGRVVRTIVRLKPEGVSIELTVTYQRDAKAGTTWVPASMREVYQSAARRLECEATYSKIRRFQVTTEEIQKRN